MKWDVSYRKATTDEMFYYSNDTELNYDGSFVESTSKIDAINKVKSNIAELMRCNCLEVEESEDSLTVFEPSDHEFIESYTNFNAVLI